MKAVGRIAAHIVAVLPLAAGLAGRQRREGVGLAPAALAPVRERDAEEVDACGAVVQPGVDAAGGGGRYARTCCASIEGQPALFLDGCISPIFDAFFSVFSLFSPS